MQAIIQVYDYITFSGQHGNNDYITVEFVRLKKLIHLRKSCFLFIFSKSPFLPKQIMVTIITWGWVFLIQAFSELHFWIFLLFLKFFFFFKVNWFCSIEILVKKKLYFKNVLSWPDSSFALQNVDHYRLYRILMKKVDSSLYQMVQY